MARLKYRDYSVSFRGEGRGSRIGRQGPPPEIKGGKGKYHQRQKVPLKYHYS